MKDYSSHVGIVGGGISGLAVGCALELHGVKTIIFERGKDISEYGAGISISPNGLRLLEKLGTKEDFIRQAKDAHPDKNYGYEKVEYINAVKI